MKRHETFRVAAEARAAAVAPPESPQYPSPYLTTQELAVYLRFTTLTACRRWLDRNPGLPFVRRGERTRLYDRRIVDAYVGGELPKLRAMKRKRTG